MPTPGLSGLHVTLAHGMVLEEIRGLDHLAESVINHIQALLSFLINCNEMN